METCKIVKVGEIQSNIISIIVEEFNKKFKSKFVLSGEIPMPEKSYDKYRNQYNSEIILKNLENEKRGNEKIIGITSSDVFTKELNFIFGINKNNVILISTARLDPEFYDEEKNFEILLERTKKQIIHELGHVFSLEHCKNPSCVMSKSDSISYLDDKNENFCKECTLKMSMEGIEI